MSNEVASDKHEWGQAGERDSGNHGVLIAAIAYVPTMCQALRFICVSALSEMYHVRRLKLRAFRPCAKDSSVACGEPWTRTL